jgi:hypothetical protein
MSLYSRPDVTLVGVVYHRLGKWSNTSLLSVVMEGELRSQLLLSPNGEREASWFMIH